MSDPSDVPTNPGTPYARRKALGLNVMVPESNRLTSGDLRDFVVIFRTLGNDIEIIERAQEEQGKKIDLQGRQIGELQKAYGTIDSLCRNFSGQMEDFKAAVLKEVRAIGKVR